MTTGKMTNGGPCAGNLQARLVYGAYSHRTLKSFVLHGRKVIRVLLDTINGACRRWMPVNTVSNALPECSHGSVNLMTPLFVFGFVVLVASNACGHEYRERREFTSYSLSSNVNLAEGVHASVLPYNGNELNSYVKIDTIDCDDYVSSLDLSNSITCEVARTTRTMVYVYYYPLGASPREDYELIRTYEEAPSEARWKEIRSVRHLSKILPSANLSNIVLPSACVTVDAQAFKGLEKLNQVVFNSTSFATINDELFDGCVSLKGQIIPTTVTKIGKRAFNRCESLSEINLPNGLQSMGEEAFANCTSLTTVKVPSGINTYDHYFAGCTNLVAIEVDADNEHFTSFDGALYDVDGRQLIVCPEGKTDITVLPTVTKIKDGAFSGCKKMRMIKMPYALGASVDESAIVAECAEDCVVTYYGPAEMLVSPNPPMAKDNNLSITPTTRNFGVNGGGNAIITSGSGTWIAAVSDPWITLNATSGNVGYPVAYTVSANTNVEQRTGYVYVSGWVHTITQDGVGGVISQGSAEFESDGGIGTIQVNVPNGIVWKSCPNDEWLSVETTDGVGDGTVTYHVEPLDEVVTRQGTLTIAGNTFAVFQYGRRMKLDTYSTTQNYETRVIPITVNALAITQWGVTPNNSWISVVDAGNGQGGDLVTIAIAENPSYKARTGTVTIGTETFTVTQQGRPTAVLSFNVSPTASTASVEGANGLVSVTATPDLPWTATSGANWLTVYAATATGAGNGNVVYVASPNPTLSQRTGTITITPDAESGMAAKSHSVTQPAAQSALSMSGYEFEASGESCSVDVSVANIVEWSVSESLDWLTVNGSTSRVGPGAVVLQASANNTVYPRSGTVTIAGKTFSVSQKARGVEIEYETMLFGTDGGYESISINPDGNSAWTAVASDPTWITIFQGDSGTGDGEILYIISPYVGDGSARMGWITIGDKKVYITQRAYDLTIEPNGTNVVGNAGAGEFGVSASIGDVWTAIVTEPWITLVSGYDAGTGSGTVRFLFTENTTGKTRTGKIIVAGEVYTLEQRARTMVAITATAEHGGHVSGGGSYDLGTSVTLTAVPDSGYSFSYWTGAVESMQNPLVLTADVAKSVTAVFAPQPIAFTGATSGEDGVSLSWNNLAWAATYRIYRGVTSVPSAATVLAELPNDGNCSYLDESGEVGVEYWYWIEAEGASDEVASEPMTGRKLKPVVISPIAYANLRGAANPNPATYQEGTLVSFSNPGAVVGYTFAGWTPSQITAEMTGAQTVSAAWTANSYSIAYDPNGGSGTMNATAMTYDAEGLVASNDFIWAGHVFAGWATNGTGAVVYAAGQSVSNLTAQSSGVVTLYAVWEDLVVATPVVSPADGTVFTEDSCMVTLSCATEGAAIYYAVNGAPRATDRFLYSGQFAISDTAEIVAFARKDGVTSGTLRATITKRTLTLADVTGATNLTFATGGDAAWTPIADATVAYGFSAQSGAIGDAANYGEFTETWLETSVSGAGTLTFRWKVDCEHDDVLNACSYDCLYVTTNALGSTPVIVAAIDGQTGWSDGMSLTFADSGTKKVRWTFRKDDYNEDVFADRAWLSGVTWTPNAAAEPIPAVAVDAAPEAVTNAIEAAGFADAAAIKAAIGGEEAATKYAAFKAWAGRVKGATGSASAASAAGEAAVVANTNAAAAFLLGAERLFENAPKIEFGEVAISRDGDAGGGGLGTSRPTMAVSIVVKDGEEAVKCAAEKVKEMFEATSDLGDWAGSGRDGARPSQGAMPITVTVEDGVGDTMCFKVTPGDGTATRAFLRVKVK